MDRDCPDWPKQREPAAKLRGRVGLILLVAAAGAVWWGINRSEPRVGWLRVEAPRYAVAGQALPMRLHLAPQMESGYVCVDLHWGTSRDTSVGYLATGGAKALSKEGGTFEFAIVVSPAQGLRFVTGIIFLSPTGHWPDHTLIATTEVIPVSSVAVRPAESPLEPLRLQPPSDKPQTHSHPVAIPRFLTAVLFLASVVLAWGANPSPEVHLERRDLKNRRGQVLVVLLALACLWELLGLENWLGAQARAMARADDFYYPRAVFQKAAVSLAIAATTVFLIFVYRSRTSNRRLLIALGLYLGVSAVNLMSLHALDRIAELAWHGLSLVQALKLCCSAIIVREMIRTRWLSYGRP